MYQEILIEANLSTISHFKTLSQFFDNLRL